MVWEEVGPGTEPWWGSGNNGSRPDEKKIQGENQFSLYVPEGLSSV